jgi:hypothetical protein
MTNCDNLGLSERCSFRVLGLGMASEERNSDRAKKYIPRLDQISENASSNPR